MKICLFAVFVLIILWITCSESAKYGKPHLVAKGRLGQLLFGKRTHFRRKNFFIRARGKTTIDCRKFCKRNHDGSLAGRTCDKRGPRSRVFCRICRSNEHTCGTKDIFS
ncbi:uncharacterized protein LOC120338309 [Styela clava]